MKINLLFAFLVLGQIVFGQTEKHVKVAGTKYSLIPPNGFIAASNFSGFQNAETGASIMINEIPTPYQSMVDGFTTEALKTRGMTLISKQTVAFNNSKATLICVTQAANGINYLKQILIFGDTKKTVLVNGIYPEASKSFEPKIKEALFTTVYNASQNDSPLDAATFSINVSNTEFKLVKYLSGSLLYSTDGKIPTEKPTLIVGNSIAKIPTSNQKTYAEERLKKLPGGDRIVLKQNNEVNINNLKGYEIIAEGKTRDNTPEMVYQVMLFNDNGDYYIIIGQTKEDFQTYLEIFQRIARTFKRK